MVDGSLWSMKLTKQRLLDTNIAQRDEDIKEPATRRPITTAEENQVSTVLKDVRAGGRIISWLDTYLPYLAITPLNTIFSEPRLT